MNEKVETDVIIVGAGPTGLALACQLIRYGVDFIIFDEEKSISDLSKAIAVQARTLEIYEQMDLPTDSTVFACLHGCAMIKAV